MTLAFNKVFIERRIIVLGGELVKSSELVGTGSDEGRVVVPAIISTITTVIC